MHVREDRARFGQRLTNLALSSELCDAFVVCEGKCSAEGSVSYVRVPVVRAVLAAASPSFDDAIRGLPKDGGASELRLPLTENALRCAIAYLTGSEKSAKLAECSFQELSEAAKALDLPGLEGWCHRVCGVKNGRSSLSSNRQLDRGSRVVVASGLMLVIILIYFWAPSRNFMIDNNGFFMDDRMIGKNKNVFEEHLDWNRLCRTDYWGLEMFDGSWTHKSFRPLTVLTFRWNYILHGFESAGFHVTNVLLHFGASALLGIFGSTVAGLPSRWGLLLAAVFLAHPVHTESVLYIVGRADIICLVIILVAALVYGPCLKQYGPNFLFTVLLLLVASALLVAAGLCKETGFCFYGLFVGWEVLALLSRQSKSRHWIARPRWHRYVRLVLLLIVGGCACYWRCWYTAGTTIERMDPHSNPIQVEKDFLVRALSYALVHGIYAQLLVWPSFLCYDYSFDAIPVVREAFDLRLLLPISAYLAFFVLFNLSMRVLMPSQAKGTFLKHAREAPIVGLAVVVLSFFPMSNLVFPVGTMIGERLLYIPSAGLLLCLVGLVHVRQSQSGGMMKHVPAIIMVCVGFVYAWLCGNRVLDWASPEAIQVADGLKQLRSSRVQFNYGNVLLLHKKYDEALETYQRAIAIDPADRDSLPLYHAGQILIYKGRHQEAVDYLRRAVAGYFSPLTINEEEIWHDYALAKWFTEDAQGAVENFWNALTIKPTHTKSLNNLGCAQGLGALLGRLPVDMIRHGIDSLRNAIALEPTSILYWRNIVALFRIAGDVGGASEAWAHLQAHMPEGAEGEPPSDCSWEFNFR